MKAENKNKAQIGSDILLLSSTRDVKFGNKGIKQTTALAVSYESG
jgi:hypothetical protein